MTVERRVYVSRVFDREFQKSAKYDPDLLPIFRDRIDQLIRAAGASPAQRAGWKQVRREVLTAFARYLGELGIGLSDQALTVSQRRIREARYYRIVDVRNHDRKAYDDHRPRISRRNDLLYPMQQIVMDAKVIDCAVRRADGTRAWPRITFLANSAAPRIRMELIKAGLDR